MSDVAREWWVYSKYILWRIILLLIYVYVSACVRMVWTNFVNILLDVSKKERYANKNKIATVNLNMRTFSTYIKVITE